jgi:putative redox protein
MANRATLELETVAGTGLVFRATAGSGGSFVLDSAKAPQGMSPVEALLAALGACQGMDVIAILRKKRQQVTGYSIEVLGARQVEHPRKFTRIDVVHRVRGHHVKLAAVAEAVRLSETKYCSVHATIAPGVSIVSRIEILPE